MKRVIVLFVGVLAAGCGHSTGATAATSSRSTTSTSAPVASGTITGTFRIVGGPAPGVNRAIPGTVTATASSGQTARASSTAARGYSLELPAGTYRVSGTSPNINGGSSQCVVPNPVVVKPGDRLHVDVQCDVP